jgi:Nitroreductase family
MNEKIPLEQIQSILEKAVFSPSGDNCQPWVFKWYDEVLHIINDESRSRHPLDPHGITSVVTLGCVIESIIIVASDYNLKANYTLNNQLPLAAESWAEIRFSIEEIVPDELSKYILKRTTDRRSYHGGISPISIIDDINSHLDERIKARLHVASSLSDELVKYIVDSEGLLAHHSKALMEVLKWVRVSIKTAKKTGDGMSWRNMQVKYWEYPLIILFKNVPWAIKLFRPLFKSQLRIRAKKQLLSSAALICVSIPKDGNSIENAVDAGRLMMRAWLSMTKIGYGSQPLTFSSMPIFYKHQNVLDDFFTKKIEHITKGENVLRSTFSLSEDQLPVWILRTGVSTELSENERTFRRPIS